MHSTWDGLLLRFFEGFQLLSIPHSLGQLALSEGI
jgi:hypothetical protein